MSREPDRLCLRPAGQAFCSELNLKGDSTGVAAAGNRRIWTASEKHVVLLGVKLVAI